jgi:glycosyltransferase involved in cell wall biosynthesis
MSQRVTIVRSGLQLPSPERDELVVSFDEFRQWLRRGRVLAHVARHREGRILVSRLESAGRPLPLGIALRMMSRGPLSLEDTSGQRRALTTGLLAQWAAQIALEPLRVRRLLRHVESAVDRIESELRLRRTRPVMLNLSESPIYLRSDLSFGARAGGSVSHTAGVINELDALPGPVIVVTTDEIPTLKPRIEVHHIMRPEAFWQFKELPSFVLNGSCEAAVDAALGQRVPSFIYQRYTPNNFTGLVVARRRSVPFVLEYNGSEVWVARHWGRPLKHERLTERIERLNAAAADLIVVVSRPLADELAERGIDRKKILVNPNGVNPDMYSPDVDGSAVRERYGLHDRTVIGFIGTFGPWHGAEALARAFALLLGKNRNLRDRVRLLMIGDGATMASVRRIVSDDGVSDSVVFTGLVPQDEGPQHLAASDLFASPHVPNSDGTRFFGSPTKVFEYMAMGRAIVASDLEQIGEVLEHGRTAWLVKPGDAGDLAAGLERLILDAGLRERLGVEARRRVLERYTWRAHVRRTIDRLQEIVPVAHAAASSTRR